MYIKTFIAGLLNTLLFLAALAGSVWLCIFALPYLSTNISPESNNLTIVIWDILGSMWGVIVLSAAIAAAVLSIVFIVFSIAQMRRIKTDAARFRARRGGTTVYIVFTFVFALALAASNLIIIDESIHTPYIIPTAAAVILLLSDILLLLDIAGNKKRLKKQKEQALMNNFSQQMGEKEL